MRKHRFLCFLTVVSLVSGMIAGFPVCSHAGNDFPFSVTDGVLDYPDQPEFAQLKVPEQADSLSDLAYGIDAALYDSWKKEGRMVYFSLGEDLLQEASADTQTFVLRVLQISLLGHNFCFRYDDSLLDQGRLGFWIEMPQDYAARPSVCEEASPVMHYEFYRNSLQQTEGELSFSRLPVCRENRQYLAAENSEQLIFAVENGYLPWCGPESDAGKILARAIGILSRITRENMTETQTYQAIYQYVLLSSQYDYDTLLDIHSRGYENPSFFLEGALLEGRAVCDGLCKELVLLARLAGLEAYHVGAYGEDSSHAYVYVKADDVWYLSCPTYGSNRYTRKDGMRQDYHTCNYMLTDFDTNMEGWNYDSDAFEEVETRIRNTEPYDYWRETHVEIGGKAFSFHPETVEEATAVLEDALQLYDELQVPVEVELCGKVSILREAYSIMKEKCGELVYLSGGTFEQQRLQVYLFGG